MQLHLAPLRRALAGLACASVLAGCEQAAGPGSGDSDLALSFEVPRSSASFSLAPGDSAPAGILTLDSVQVVLARVKLHRADDGEDCAEGADDRCESFTAGPVLVNLPVKGGRVTPFATRPLAGTYDRLDFKIHRPEGNDSSTRAFRAAHGGWPASAAVRIVGKYNTAPFDVFFRTEAQIRQRFDPPLTIGDTTSLGSVGLTVTVDAEKWLVVNGASVDPRSLTSNPRLLAAVEKNIRESFRVKHSRGRSDDQGKGKDDDRERGKSGKKDD